MTQVPKTSILLSASMSSPKQKYIYTFPGANRGLQGMFFFQDYNQILPSKKNTRGEHFSTNAVATA
jgi:hypothetical protein